LAAPKVDMVHVSINFNDVDSVDFFLLSAA